ncbi:hypothetical protein BDV11DRAFT_176927 [Aspergillus similis]
MSRRAVNSRVTAILESHGESVRKKVQKELTRSPADPQRVHTTKEAKMVALINDNPSSVVQRYPISLVISPFR